MTLVLQVVVTQKKIKYGKKWKKVQILEIKSMFFSEMSESIINIYIYIIQYGLREICTLAELA